MTDYYLPMTVEEICRDYRMAKDKRNQIEILADRNLCTKEVIEDVLRSRGEELSEDKPVPRAVKWTVQEEDRLRKLAGEGKTSKEIAVLMFRTHKAVEQKLSKMHISLRQPPVKLEALPTAKDIVDKPFMETVDELEKEAQAQAQEMAELAAKEANAATPEVNLEDIIKDFKRTQAEGELRRLREDAVSDTLLTLLFDTLYSTDLNASLETVFARFGIKLLDYLKER